MSRSRHPRPARRPLPSPPVVQEASNSASAVPIKTIGYRGVAVGIGLFAIAFGLTYLLTPRRSKPPERIAVSPPASSPTETATTPATAPPGPAPEGMVWVPGGRFSMGCDDPSMRDARPWHEVSVDGFWMDRTEVTNAEFARFVQAVGHVTSAERALDPKLFPGVPAAELAPSGVTFSPPNHAVSLNNHMQWWKLIPGADWRHPEGPGSDIQDKPNHPVVHVGWNDAQAYAKWAGKRLPTEAQWERAARGGIDRSTFVWGEDMNPGGHCMANTWQGKFPVENLKTDGYRLTAPVGQYPPNGFGLVDMAGNVWEWCSDWYRPDYYRYSPSRSPQGPESSHDPLEPGVPKRVQRGGSFLCSDEYCKRYNPGGRGKGNPSDGASHVGFRCVKDVR